jgi:hypothetical protein
VVLVACTGERGSAYRNLVGKLKGKGQVLRPVRRYGGKTGMNFKDIVWRCGVDSSVSGRGLVEGSYGHGNESSGSIRRGEFRDYQR